MNQFTTPENDVHRLKAWPEFYTALAAGTKTFEFRPNDRDFKVGDLLLLQEWRPPRDTQDVLASIKNAEAVQGSDVVGEYTGRELLARISYRLPFEYQELSVAGQTITTHRSLVILGLADVVDVASGLKIGVYRTEERPALNWSLKGSIDDLLIRTMKGGPEAVVEAVANSISERVFEALNKEVRR